MRIFTMPGSGMWDAHPYVRKRSLKRRIFPWLLTGRAQTEIILSALPWALLAEAGVLTERDDGSYVDLVFQTSNGNATHVVPVDGASHSIGTLRCTGFGCGTNQVSQAAWSSSEMTDCS